MKIDKAIEILKELNIDRWRPLPPNKQDAVNLGIEALKAVAKMRHYPFPDEILQLPGETTIIDTTRSNHSIKNLLESPLGREHAP